MSTPVQPGNTSRTPDNTPPATTPSDTNMLDQWNTPATPTYRQTPPYATQPTPPVSSTDSIGAWMLALLLTGIPVVGLIYILVVAFGASTSLARKNWARAMLAWRIIIIVLFLIVLIATGGAIGSFMRNY